MVRRCDCDVHAQRQWRLHLVARPLAGTRTTTPTQTPSNDVVVRGWLCAALSFPSLLCVAALGVYHVRWSMRGLDLQPVLAITVNIASVPLQALLASNSSYTLAGDNIRDASRSLQTSPLSGQFSFRHKSIPRIAIFLHGPSLA
jgi:hypothetical protein